MTSTSRTGAALFLAGSLAGLAISIYSYLTPLTGITGTPGALLVIGSCGALSVAALLLYILSPGVWRGIFVTLSYLGLVGTFAAAWFLHAWFLMAAMIIALIGLLILNSARGPVTAPVTAPGTAGVRA